MLESVEIYVWVYAGTVLDTLKVISEDEHESFKSRYGHAAMLIPWCSGVPGDPPKGYPLYVSLWNKGRFKNKEYDITYWESVEKGCRQHCVKLPCTQAQIIQLWQSVLAMKDPQYADEANFEEWSGYCIPFTAFSKDKVIYKIPFNLTAHRESGGDNAHNCTTFIFKLLNDAGVGLSGDHPVPNAGSNKRRAIATGILQLLGSAAAGYNLGVAIEICEVCLPEETKHVQRGAYISLAIMAVALITDMCCLPRLCQRGNRVYDAMNKRCPIPASVLTSLSIPLFAANFIILIYIAVIHAKYHTLFDTAPVVGPFIGGLLLGIGCCVFSIVRSQHKDAHTYCAKPEGLLELLPDYKQESNDHQLVELDKLGQENHLAKNTQFKPLFAPSALKASSSVSLDKNLSASADNEAVSNDEDNKIGMKSFEQKYL